MPSHTPAEAFIKLWSENDIPWKWPAWKSLTGINHGLFPADGSPSPSGWSPVDARDIRSYFDQYLAKGSEDAKKRFASQRKGGEVVPGREKWRRWIGERWRVWGLHAIIVDCLSEERIHPITILRGSSIDKWPPGDMWIPIAIDSIALKLFGPAAMDDAGERAIAEIRTPIQICVQKVWDTLRRQHVRGRKDLERYKTSAEEAFSELNNPPITKDKIRKAMRLFNRWKLLAELFNVQDDLEGVARMMATISSLFDAMGKKVGEPPSDRPSEGFSKPTKEMLAELASEEDVADLVRLYDDLFSADPDETNAFADHAEVDPVLCDLSHDGDLGVDYEFSMDEVRLNHELGFVNSRPFQFASLRHHLGLNGWDHPGFLETLQTTHPHAVNPIHLHWHQLAGVHATIRGLFNTEPRAAACRGMLIADEVGLGKTAIALSVIAFLNHAIWLGDSGRSLPPILQNFPYLGTCKTIPALPHIVIVPVTLINQWEQEFKIFFLPKKIDILVYQGSKAQRQDFWGESGPLSKSKHDKQQVIILATHAALQSDFLTCYMGVNKSKDRKPWDLPKAQKAGFDLSKTMFGQRYLTVTFDEIHQMRNIGVKYYAALRMREQAEVILGLTATPLQTAPKDILAIGRVIGIPKFLEEESVEEEKNENRVSRRAQRNVAVTKVESEEEHRDALNGLRLAHLSAIARMHKSFAGHIIRRTPDSKDYQGKCLLKLPPCVATHAILKLTDREMEIILNLAEMAKESISTANGLKGFATKQFYLEYRMAFGFAREDPDSKIPAFKTLQEWMPVRSTKLDVCARLCKHLLSRDDASPVTFHDGEPSFPELPSTPCTSTRRILIYQEFPSLGPLLRNILSLYGVQSCYLDGRVRPPQRREVVEKFHTPNGPRVLIFSSVGTAGLNLSIADTIILLDQPWSAQDERQIRGRAHRQPQKKTVHVYHLLADKTTDILLSGMAQGKSELLEAFLNHKAGQDLVQLLSGKALDDDESIEHETRDRRKQSTAVTDTDPDENPEQVATDFDAPETQELSRKKETTTPTTTAKKRKRKPSNVADTDPDENPEHAVTDAPETRKPPRKKTTTPTTTAKKRKRQSSNVADTDPDENPEHTVTNAPETRKPPQKRKTTAQPTPVIATTPTSTAASAETLKTSNQDQAAQTQQKTDGQSARQTPPTDMHTDIDDPSTTHQTPPTRSKKQTKKPKRKEQEKQALHEVPPPSGGRPQSPNIRSPEPSDVDLGEDIQPQTPIKMYQLGRKGHGMEFTKYRKTNPLPSTSSRALPPNLGLSGYGSDDKSDGDARGSPPSSSGGSLAPTSGDDDEDVLDTPSPTGGYKESKRRPSRGMLLPTSNLDSDRARPKKPPSPPPSSLLGSSKRGYDKGGRKKRF